MGLQDEVQALKAISVEELQEQADEVDYLTPREFAKLQGVHAQQVYNWIRKGVIEAERCKCGRTVVCVSKAKAALDKKKRARGEIIRPEDDPQNVGRGSDVSIPSEPEASSVMEASAEIYRRHMDTFKDT